MHILQLRQGLTETRHLVSAVAVPADGGRGATPGWSTGPAAWSTWRSAAKPLQLWASLEALDDDADLDDADLAIGASSHSGQDQHLAGVRAVLARYGIDEAALACGAEPPVHTATRQGLLRAGKPFLPIHNDCSGKHAFMLAACRARGWPTDSYLSPDHPVQRRIVDLARQWCGEEPGLATDGCGVPTLWLSLTAMSRAWARIAVAVADPDTDPRLHRIGRAMLRHPDLTSGDERIDLAVARRAAEPLVGKIGARGIFCIALPQRGLGVTIKVHDGDEDALAVAIPAVLDRVAPGALGPDDAWPWATMCNVAGVAVGRRVAVGTDGV